MSGLPDHVAQAITTRTGVDPRGIGRRPRLTTCPTCHTPVLRGLDADMCAFEATTDTTPINGLGEIHALVTGRATYELRGTPPALTYRDQDAIRARPPNRTTVLPEHACNTPPLPPPPKPPAKPAATPKDTNATPPF